MHACSASQSCPTLYNPMDCSPLGSSVHGIFQTRILGLPFPPSRECPDEGSEPECLVSPALAGEFFSTEPPGEPNEQVNPFKYEFLFGIQGEHRASCLCSPSQDLGTSLTWKECMVSSGMNEGLPSPCNTAGDGWTTGSVNAPGFSEGEARSHFLTLYSWCQPGGGCPLDMS